MQPPGTDSKPRLAARSGSSPLRLDGAAPRAARAQAPCALGQDTSALSLLWAPLAALLGLPDMARSPLPLPGEHSVPLPGCFPLPTSPSRLPAHLSELWDEVPTSTPWTPDPQVPWSPASSRLCYHPAASPTPRAAHTASTREGTFSQEPAPRSCGEAGVARLCASPAHLQQT